MRGVYTDKIKAIEVLPCVEERMDESIAVRRPNPNEKPMYWGVYAVVCDVHPDERLITEVKMHIMDFELRIEAEDFAKMLANELPNEVDVTVSS